VGLHTDGLVAQGGGREFGEGVGVGAGSLGARDGDGLIGVVERDAMGVSSSPCTAPELLSPLQRGSKSSSGFLPVPRRLRNPPHPIISA